MMLWLNLYTLAILSLVQYWTETDLAQAYD